MRSEIDDYQIVPFDPTQCMVFKAHPLKQALDELKATRERARDDLGPCSHPTHAQELVFVDSSHGIRMFAFECQECGCLPKMWVKAAKLTAEQKRSARPRDKHWGRSNTRRGRAAELVSYLSDRLSESFGLLYEVYVGEMSSEWRTRRLGVFFRDGLTCRYCGRNTAQEVHHLSYQNLGDEPLDELISICRDCHRDKHNDNEDS